MLRTGCLSLDASTTLRFGAKLANFLAGIRSRENCFVVRGTCVRERRSLKDFDDSLDRISLITRPGERPSLTRMASQLVRLSHAIIMTRSTSPRLETWLSLLIWLDCSETTSFRVGGRLEDGFRRMMCRVDIVGQ